MAKGERQKGKIEEEEEEEKPVIEVSSGDDDDDEANEDLSLKIVEKAMLMRASNLAENVTDGVILLDDDNVSMNDTGVVGVSGGGNSDGKVVELSSSSSLDVGTVVKDSAPVKKRKEKKKKKIRKGETEDRSDAAPKEERTAEIMEKVESMENAKADQTAVDLVENVDPNAVQLSDNIVLRKLLRGPRYFDPPDSGWSACFNCGKEGHMAVNCPTLQKKKRPCFLCGSLEHSVKQCSKERVCIICKSGGHRPKRCPEKHKGGPQYSKVCLKCGDSEHDMFSCKNNYSLDDLKEIQCYICKSFGHLCCVNFVDNSPREVSCYKCGELGHSGLECFRLHEEATTAASASSCFKCGEEGHFARECTSSAKAGERNHRLSTPVLRHHGENKEATGVKSAPPDLGKSRKRRKTKSEGRSIATPKKSKQRGGWITEDPEDHHTPKNSKQRGGWIMEDLEDMTHTPKKSKQRGGWIMEDPEDLSHTPKKSKQRGGWIIEDPRDLSWSKSKKNGWWSPSTSSYKGHKLATGGQTSSSQSSKRMYNSHSGMSDSQSSKKMHKSHFGSSAWQGSDRAFQNHLGPSAWQGSGSAFQNHLGPSAWQGSGRAFQNHLGPSAWHGSGTAFQNHLGPSAWQGSGTAYQHRFSASRFSNPGNSGLRGNYNWW